MRSVFIVVAVAAAIGLLAPTASEASGQRLGAGIEFDAVQGDINNAVGGYTFFEFDLPEPFMAMLEVSYVGGDFDVESGSGSYTILGVGGALLFVHSFDSFTGYTGAGGANNFNSFDGVNYDDKASIFWMGGARFPVSRRLSADFSIRYRALRIDSIDRDVKPNPLDADAVVVRAGLVLDL